MTQAPELGSATTPGQASVEDAQLYEIENKLLQGIFGCRSEEAVEAAITYASFLGSAGTTPENYPVFLKLLEVENHWVIDALIGSRDPALLLSSVQPDRFIVERTLAMITRWHKGGIYRKNLSVVLGVLQSVYSSASDGYRIYPLTIADANALGKHLDKGKGQDDPLNRAILEVLEKIADLESAADPQMEGVAMHASAIRNAFFDDRKKMENVIPPVLLVTVDSRNEVPPRRRIPVNGAASTEPEAKTSTAGAKKAGPGARKAAPEAIELPEDF
jgi:hypothetical protein